MHDEDHSMARHASLLTSLKHSEKEAKSELQSTGPVMANFESRCLQKAGDCLLLLLFT